VPVFEHFFQEIDASWRWPAADKILIRILGSAALMLQADYKRGTKDGDVLETEQLTTETQERLVGLAGRDSAIHTRHHIYIDIVMAAIPFLPQVPLWHSKPKLSASLRHFEVEVLDVVDVIVSKLKRFNANDVSDIEAMVDRDLVPHDALIDRFRLAVDWFSMDARADEIPQYVKNLHRVERDIYAINETEVELPSWV
jgi:hypothetical protein